MNFKSRFPLVATLVTFTAVVIMFALGVWQLQRADQKSQRLNSIQLAAKTKNTLSLAQANDLKKNALDMSVSFDGRLDTEHYFLLDNKTHQGKIGYEVLAIANTNEGNTVVNLGWLAAPVLRSELPAVHFSGDSQALHGMLAIPKNNKLITETAVVDQQWPKVLQQADLQVIARHYQQTLLPFIILLDDVPESGFVRQWQPVVMPPEKHIAYAIQWFLLGSAALIIFIVAQRKKLKREQQ